MSEPRTSLECRSDAARFLDALRAPYREWEGAPLFLEIRCLVTRGVERSSQSMWLPIDHDEDDVIDIVSMAMRQRERADIYVGVVPRVEKGKGADDCRIAGMFWVDIDTKDVPLNEAMVAVAGADMIVLSGGGVHAYWRCPLTGVGTKREREIFSLALRNFQHRIHPGADPRTHDVARILRLPGTRNHKYDPPADVVLERCMEDTTLDVAGCKAAVSAWDRAMYVELATTRAFNNRLPEIESFVLPSGSRCADVNAHMRALAMHRKIGVERGGGSLTLEAAIADIDAILMRLEGSGWTYASN